MNNEQWFAKRESMETINDKLREGGFEARIYPEEELARWGVMIPNIFLFEDMVEKDAKQWNISTKDKALRDICREIYPQNIEVEIESLFSKM